MRSIVYVLGVCFILAACGRLSLKSDEYKTWVENPEHGLSVTKQIGDYTFSTQYKPIDYVVLMENQGETVSEQILQHRKDKLNGALYLTFTIHHPTGVLNPSRAEEYATRQDYFLQHAKSDFSLLHNQDTVACRLYNFEQNFGLVAHNNIVLAFDEQELTEDLVLVFNDRVLGVGPIKMKIEKDAVSNIPVLDLE